MVNYAALAEVEMNLLGYVWRLIAGGVHCARCARFVGEAWLRRCDDRPICDDCHAMEFTGRER